MLASLNQPNLLKPFHTTKLTKNGRKPGLAQDTATCLPGHLLWLEEAQICEMQRPLLQPTRKSNFLVRSSFHAVHKVRTARSDNSSMKLPAPDILSNSAGREGFPLSTHECWWEGTLNEEEDSTALSPGSNHTVCTYTNLVLWHQQMSLSTVNFVAEMRWPVLRSTIIHPGLVAMHGGSKSIAASLLS